MSASPSNQLNKSVPALPNNTPSADIRLLLILSMLVWGTLAFGQAWSGILDLSRAIDWSTAGIPGGIPDRTTICTSWYNGSGAPSGSLGNNGDYYFRTDVGHASAEYKKSSGTWATTGSEFYVDVNSALSACASGDVVYLNAGTYYAASTITIPSNVSLRGAGANQTILSSNGTSGNGVVVMGSYNLNIASDLSITSGWTPGSTSIVVSSASGISVGTLLQLTELNDLSIPVQTTGSEGSQANDGGVGYNGQRVMGQISKVTNVSGTTLTISPPLMPNVANVISAGWTANTKYPWNAIIVPSTQPTHAYRQTVQSFNSPYFCTSGSSAPAFPANGTSVSDGGGSIPCKWLDTGTNLTLQPHATPFTPTQYAGLENLQIYANNTGAGSNIIMTQCLYCWVSGVEGNYTDGDHMDIDFGLGDEVVNSYFSNAYTHSPGQYDSDVDLRTKTTATLIQNNIFERLHASIMLEWGATGNVIAYNYSFGVFDTNSQFSNLSDVDMHGAHTQYNLFEGNVLGLMGPDSTWGSKSDNTTFRQYLQGTTKGCNPLSGRGTVSCTPVYPTSGYNGWWEFQQSRVFSPTFEDTNWNSVGNVLGSANQSNLFAYGSHIGLTFWVVAVCGPSPCGPGSRSYDTVAYTYGWGYGEGADDGSSGFDSLVPYTTGFVHGDFSNISGSIEWANGVTHTLPASFYLSAKPSWWGSAPYPPIGPDVTGGTGPGGHAYTIPAQNCYTSVMGGTDGTGSPLSFNANTCYGGSAPAPPSNLTATPH
jgi:hypothetical protein